jgi:16S rRNA (guanine(966)-N(2))-methyltransferase RsmD
MAARVISGKAKGRRLKLVPGDTTRPIMDRVKENLFNILGDINGTRWLDMYAGTGQVGIEALSRGAAEVVFVDKARAAVQTVRDNLAHTQLTAGATVVQGDALAYLRDMGEPPFDVIYIAPPQYLEMWIGALQAIDKDVDRYLAADAQAIAQIDPREYRELELSRLVLADQRRYGNTLLCFYERGLSPQLSSVI